MRRIVPVLLACCACAPVFLNAQLTTPTSWKWRQDAPAPLSAGGKMEPGSWVFVQMPPGWHVTTGPGVLLYPAKTARSTGTSRSSPRSSCSLERRPTSTASSSAVRTVKNILKVDVDPTNVTLWVNAAKVVAVQRADVRIDGRVGFRIGKDMNLHITTLNMTRKLAPIPIKKE